MAKTIEETINNLTGKPVTPLLGSKSKFAQKYPDRFANIKANEIWKTWKNQRDIEDVDFDAIAKIMGVDLD